MLLLGFKKAFFWEGGVYGSLGIRRICFLFKCVLGFQPIQFIRETYY